MREQKSFEVVRDKQSTFR